MADEVDPNVTPPTPDRPFVPDIPMAIFRLPEELPPTTDSPVPEVPVAPMDNREALKKLEELLSKCGPLDPKVLLKPIRERKASTPLGRSYNPEQFTFNATQSYVAAGQSPYQQPQYQRQIIPNGTFNMSPRNPAMNAFGPVNLSDFPTSAFDPVELVSGYRPPQLYPEELPVDISFGDSRYKNVPSLPMEQRRLNILPPMTPTPHRPDTSMRNSPQNAAQLTFNKTQPYAPTGQMNGTANLGPAPVNRTFNMSPRNPAMNATVTLGPVNLSDFPAAAFDPVELVSGYRPPQLFPEELPVDISFGDSRYKNEPIMTMEQRRLNILPPMTPTPDRPSPQNSGGGQPSPQRQIWLRENSTPMGTFQNNYQDLSQSYFIAGQEPHKYPTMRSPALNDARANQNSPRLPVIENQMVPETRRKGASPQKMDEYLPILDSYTKEILKEFQKTIAKDLKDSVQVKVNQFLDEKVTPEMLKAILDVLLPHLFSKALQEITMSTVDIVLKSAFGPNVIKKVFPLMAKGRVACNKPCFCRVNLLFPDMPAGTRTFGTSPCKIIGGECDTSRQRPRSKSTRPPRPPRKDYPQDGDDFCDDDRICPCIDDDPICPCTL